MHYRVSFEYSPIKTFFNSNFVDAIVLRGDVSFDWQRFVNLLNNVICYVSLNELTIPNTDYNINTNNNTLVLQDYSVSTLMTALNAAFAALFGNFQNITVIYSDTRNKYPLTTSANTNYNFTFLAASTKNSVLGFAPGLVNNSEPKTK